MCTDGCGVYASCQTGTDEYLCNVIGPGDMSCPAVPSAGCTPSNHQEPGPTRREHREHGEPGQDPHRMLGLQIASLRRRCGARGTGYGKGRQAGLWADDGRWCRRRRPGGRRARRHYARRCRCATTASGVGRARREPRRGRGGQPGRTGGVGVDRGGLVGVRGGGCRRLLRAAVDPRHRRRRWLWRCGEWLLTAEVFGGLVSVLGVRIGWRCGCGPPSEVLGGLPPVLLMRIGIRIVSHSTLPVSDAATMHGCLLRSGCKFMWRCVTADVVRTSDFDEAVKYRRTHSPRTVVTRVTVEAIYVAYALVGA